MTTLFLKNGNDYKPIDEANLNAQATLPPGNYIIKQQPFDGPLYFEKVDDFEIPKKVYGDVTTMSKRILSTFNSRPGTTGVLLSGEKGSGKTLLAKFTAATSEMPCILVNSPLTGDKFSKLLQDVEQPAIVLFDEFEKVYDDESQPGILTLLDGVFTSKKLFILTCNDIWKINEHMKNRPGRLFYSVSFNGLSLEFIREYCDDNLRDRAYSDKVCDISMLFAEFNFDMLSALVEEMNRYSESPEDAMKMLNVQPDSSSSVSMFKMTLLIDGDEKEITSPKGGILDKNPLL